MSKPFYSIGMIVKNEIRSIEKCLKALQPLRDAVPCELIIADTGSDDGTREVAQRYADELFDFPWVDDFAAARNAVMERCHGKWYFTVDADEYLDPDVHELVKFSHLPPQKWPETLFVNQRNYNSTDLEHGEYTDFLAQRLARLDTGIHYEGSIHEGFIQRNGAAILKAAYLESVVLHHDGYALASVEDRLRKSRRNLELLDRELEKEPENLRRLNQCIESSGNFPAKQAAYVVRGMEILCKHPDRETDISAPGLSAHCALVAAIQELPQAEAWIRWSRERFPDHVATRIDTAYAELLLDYHLEHYGPMPEIARQFVADSQRLERKEFPLLELAVVNLSANGISFVRRARVLWAVALCQLDRKEEGLTLLRGWPLAELSGESLDDWLKAMRQCADLPGAAEEMHRALELIPLHREDADESKWEQDQSNQFRTGCLAMFLEPGEKRDGVPKAWRIFLKADGPLGAGARVLDTLERTDAEAALAQTEDWRDFPPSALKWAFTLGCRFPESLYEQGAGILRNIVTVLAGEENFSAAVLGWLEHNPASSLAQQQFVWQMLAGALQKKKSFSNERLGKALCEAFYHVTAQYYPGLYRPEVLADPRQWNVLPKLGRFSLHYLRAREALDRGDQLEYVRQLRAGLELSPLMKHMVSFLLDVQEQEEKAAKAASPAMTALAEQVQAVLAQYAPDDPAVTALKESEAYQKVAWILDRVPASPAAPWEPETDQEAQSFAALEAACHFSGQEDACQAVAERFQSLPEGKRKILEDYWRKYPLWGASTEQVLERDAHALYTHWGDFAWLYQRLMDHKSRRTLLAVLRNWRSFEAISPQVFDTQYDDYFDREVLSCGGEDVVADLGAFTGDTFLSYVKNYGDNGYRCYYCYEIDPDNYRALVNAASAYPFVICRRKGAGAGPGVMHLEASQSNASANKLSQEEHSKGERVEVVALDDDITEPLTLIKMDIEGAEQSALAGCARHIREDRPKLALSVYHNFEDLWKLPRMIEDLVPGYRFYLRYHGGDLWPSEITLLALPPVEQ